MIFLWECSKPRSESPRFTADTVGLPFALAHFQFELVQINRWQEFVSHSHLAPRLSHLASHVLRLILTFKNE